MENNRVLVPMRAIFEALGYEVKWNDHLKIAGADLDMGNTKRKACLHISYLLLSVSEQEYEPSTTGLYSEPIKEIRFQIPLNPQDSPIKIVNGRTLLPTRAIAEALGCNVEWDETTNTVKIDIKDAKIIPPTGWVEAAIAHSEIYAPSQLASKQNWYEDEQRN